MSAVLHALIPHVLTVDPLTGEALNILESLSLLVAIALPFVLGGVLVICGGLYARRLGRAHVTTAHAIQMAEAHDRLIHDAIARRPLRVAGSPGRQQERAR